MSPTIQLSRARLELAFPQRLRNTTFKLLLAFALGLLAACDASARRGYVKTLDNRVVEGHLRFESNAVVIIDAAKQLWALVALTNIATVGFESEVELPDELSFDASTTPPAPWQSVDIGSVRRAGEVEFRKGTWRVRSAGTNVLGDGDSFHFIYKPVSGASELTARVARAPGSDPWACAGLMLREGLASDAKHVFLSITSARGGLLASRERKGGETTVALDHATRGSWWLKLKRDGDKITALKSPDGKRWRIVERLTLPMDEEIYAGLAVVGVRDTAPGEAIFDGLEEGASLRNRAYTPQVELRSGSQQSGWIERMDDADLRFDPLERRIPVSARDVAMIRFQPVPVKSAPLVAPGRHGVLLVTGEFIEGECGGIANHRVTVNSVPLGLKRYDVNNEVVAIVLGKRALQPRRAFEVTTTDGATWIAESVTLDRDGLLLREPSLGTRRISLSEIVELRRGG
jgi:hypothetical protein